MKLFRCITGNVSRPRIAPLSEQDHPSRSIKDSRSKAGIVTRAFLILRNHQEVSAGAMPLLRDEKPCDADIDGLSGSTDRRRTQGVTALLNALSLAEGRLELEWEPRHKIIDLLVQDIANVEEQYGKHVPKGAVEAAIERVTKMREVEQA